MDASITDRYIRRGRPGVGGTRMGRLSSQIPVVTPTALQSISLHFLSTHQIQTTQNQSFKRAPQNQGPTTSDPQKPTATATAPAPNVNKQIPAGIQQGRNANNYFRADGQNTGNFLTDRPSTKVHAAPGGGSSLGYLFGDGKN
ncbi:hypothetical protein K7X08_034725 [Anisodus acutangulus]|uniref:Uncharacterized protein n=1 Tax=Anisodus acutangulus TaxID=402998 RepID=A0A9Q1R154_9SOLA|nr:hypothetical protein K7X08_034725 [Anisodus acutangulus]